MKKTFLKTMVVISMIGGIAITSTSCKKKGCTSETATNYDSSAKKDDGTCVEPVPEVLGQAEEPINPTVQPSDADAVLIALSTVTYVDFSGFKTEIPIGLPVAIFMDGSSFKNVGAVTCETKSLERQDNNSYVHIPNATDATGVSYSGTIEWDVEGGSGFPALVHSSNGTFPGNVEPSIANNDAIDISKEFTLSTVNTISNADSVIFGVYGPDAVLLVTLAGTESSHTFSASEMTSLGKGGGYAQIAAYKMAEEQTLGTGEKVYYVNEKVNTTVVNFE